MSEPEQAERIEPLRVSGGFLLPQVEREQIERRRRAKERRMANLRPFEKGQSGNPAGRPQNAGLSVLEWLNLYVSEKPDGTSRYTLDDVENDYYDPDMPLSRRLAARMVLVAFQSGQTYSVDAKGNAVPGRLDPEPGRALTEILDRTIGKPTQTVLAGAAEPRDPQDVLAEMRALVDADPQVAAMLLATVSGQLPDSADIGRVRANDDYDDHSQSGDESDEQGEATM
jgi:hypothetical protein